MRTVAISAYLLHAAGGYRSAGVSTYVRHLLERLPAVAPQYHYVALTGPRAPALTGVEMRRSPIPTEQAPFRIAWEQIALPAQLALTRPALFHGTVNVVPLAAPVPRVVTVHDLSFLRFPERFHRSKAEYLRWAVALSARQASHIISVSGSTAADLMELVGVPEERITVVYPGVDAIFHPSKETEVESFRMAMGQVRPFALYVGTLEPRKNLDVLLEAWNDARLGQLAEYQLVIAGAPGWKYERIFSLVRELNLQRDVRFLGYVDSGQLPLWYNAANLFVYPSAYEGFGLPLLEAMACGVPCITTSSSSLREVAGDACLVVAPGSREELREAIVRMLTDESLRKTARRKGLERASLFSWERMARETAGIYDRTLQALAS